MKAIVQNLQNGKVEVEEVPPPALRPEGILVRVRRSLISLGTERAVLALASKGMLGKAKARPDLVRKVLNKAKQEGLWNTYQVVKNLITTPIPLGYSCAGEVTAAGEAVTEFRPGDRVACAGLNFANHAEIDYVPRNLATKIPEGVSYEAASFVTVGAIALHGMRLAEIELGEKVVVLGLGLVGQIAAQLARCAGATVLATDLDSHKTALAQQLGAHCVVSDPEDLLGAVAEFTEGQGADAVLICAATKSSELVQRAADISRLRGRVVIIGDVGMRLERRPYFEKEIRLVVSRSYGPGRYDPAYEVRGIDYPLPYVRWTERRNMGAFLAMLARNDLRTEPLITHRFSIEQAEAAYQVVSGEKPEPAIAILLEYEGKAVQPARVELRARPHRGIERPVRIGVIGAGQFARGVLLPALASLKSAQLHAFCTLSGFTSKRVAEHYGARYCTSDPAEVIQDKDIDAVLIATRHDQHASLTAEALQAGKAVFVEKPLALTSDSLASLCEVVQSVEAPRLMVGFNRRFSPLAVRCKKFFASSNEPLFVLYRVNAGVVPSDGWVHDPVEGGGRIVGEVCHFVDLICYLTDAVPRRITAEPAGQAGSGSSLRDSITVTVRMSDESLGVIHYLENGSPRVAKEYMEVFGGQRTAILDNYRNLTLYRENRRRRHWLFNQAKGHKQELAAFVQALQTGNPMPIDFEALVAVTQTTFLIQRSLSLGVPVDYEPPGGAQANSEPT